MQTPELAQKLVAACNGGDAEAFAREHYAEDIVSIEGTEDGGMPAKIEGLQAVLEKGAWWFDNHEVHSMNAEGPYLGLDPEQFAVKFALDVTPKGGERWQMEEIALYTVRDGKIAREQFLYRTE